MKQYLSFKNIIVLIILGVLIPLVVTSLTTLIPSPIPNFETSNDWIGFFGSYMGSILGGIITLIVMKETIESGNRNLETNIIENKKIQKRNERIQFCNHIASLIASYCYESRRYKHQNWVMNESSKTSLKSYENFLNERQKIKGNNLKQSKTNDDLFFLEISEMRYKEDKDNFDKAIETLKTIDVLRIYFELKIKLQNVKQAKKLMEKIEEVNTLKSYMKENDYKSKESYDEKFEKAIYELMQETANFIEEYTKL